MKCFSQPAFKASQVLRGLIDHDGLRPQTLLFATRLHARCYATNLSLRLAWSVCGGDGDLRVIRARSSGSRGCGDPDRRLPRFVELQWSCTRAPELGGATATVLTKVDGGVVVRMEPGGLPSVHSYRSYR